MSTVSISATSAVQAASPIIKAAWIAADQQLATALTALADTSLQQRFPSRASIEVALAAGQQARAGFVQLAGSVASPEPIRLISEKAGAAALKGIETLELILPNYDDGVRQVQALSMGMFGNAAKSARYHFEQARDARFG